MILDCRSRGEVICDGRDGEEEELIGDARSTVVQHLTSRAVSHLIITFVTTEGREEKTSTSTLSTSSSADPFYSHTTGPLPRIVVVNSFLWLDGPHFDRGVGCLSLGGMQELGKVRRSEEDGSCRGVGLEYHVTNPDLSCRHWQHIQIETCR